MTILVLIGLILALMVNHAVFLFLPHASLLSRVAVGAPIVLLLCVAAGWMIERVMSHRAMDFGSWIAWSAVALFSVFSTVALQVMYGRRSR